LLHIFLPLKVVDTSKTYKNPIEPPFSASITPYPFPHVHRSVSATPAIHKLTFTLPPEDLPSNMSYSSYGSSAATWQEKLEEKCREAQIHPPVFQIMSDRRGGRTAWSSIVTVQGQNIQARFWYDGQHVNNAKEDAAEVALKHLSTNSPSSSSQGRSGW
jgi:hypothetical protein